MTTFEAMGANFLNQVFYKRRLFMNHIRSSKAVGMILDRLHKELMAGDAMQSKVITGENFYLQYAGAGATQGKGGSLRVIEYPYAKKTVAQPVDMDLDMMMDLDTSVAADALTLAKFWEAYFGAADRMMEWLLAGDGTGKIASLGATAPTSGGVITLASTTPKIVFDTLLAVGRYVAILQDSDGAVQYSGTTIFAGGYVVENNYTAKTVHLDYVKGTTATTFASPNITGSTYGLYLCIPGAAGADGTTVFTKSSCLWGLGTLGSAIADAATNTPLHGLLNLNKYHSASQFLYTASGANDSSFQPSHVAGDATKGLNNSDLQNAVNGTAGGTVDVIATDQIIWSDWNEQQRTTNFYSVRDGDASNFLKTGFNINDKLVPVDVIPWWDGKGAVHGLSLETFGMIYSKANHMKAARQGQEGRGPGWYLRFGDMLHGHSDYYGSSNAIVYRGNFVSDGRRNYNFVIDGLQDSNLL